MSIDCVFMDLDGSTLVDRQRVAPGLGEFIRSRSKVKWVLATGRSQKTALRTEFASLIPRASPHIFDSGAVIATASNVVLCEQVLTPTDVDIAVAIIANERPHYVFASMGILPGLVYYSRTDSATTLPHAGRFTDSLDVFAKWLRHQRASKITFSFRDEKFCLPDYLNHTLNNNVVDILPAGVTKATGAAFVLRALRVDASKSAFIFNDRNDLPVVQSPELEGMTLIKVGSALPEVSAHINVASPFSVVDGLVQLWGRQL